MLKTKTCSKCKLTKEVSEFNRDNKAADGRCSQCRSCQRIKMLVWKENNRDKLYAAKKKYRDKNSVMPTKNQDAQNTVLEDNI